jgi:MoaA/NifB/PqqE/SkfB family radical SAM enzyme
MHIKNNQPLTKYRTPFLTNKFITHIGHFRFIFKYPVVLLRILQNYFLIIFFHKKRLRITDIAITFKCNASCDHCCSSLLYNPKRKRLTLTEIKECIDRTIKQGCIIYNFLGGEPLLRKDIFQMIEYVKSRHAIAGLSTNGLLLNERIVSQLKASGLDVVQVDIESLNSKELDEIRGVKDCYDKIMKGINLLKKLGIKVILSTIMTKKNVSNGEIWKIVDLARKLDVFINVNCSAKVGSWGQTSESLLTEKEEAVFHEIKTLPHTRWAGSTNFLGEYCPCGTEKIYITAYGDVMPCGLVSVSYGNIHDTDFCQIWDKMFNSCSTRRKSKSCSAAFDPDTIKVNEYLHYQKQQLPLNFDQIPQEYTE